MQGTFDTRAIWRNSFSTFGYFVVVENANTGSLLRKFMAITLSLLQVGPVEPDAVHSVAYSSPATRATLPSLHVEQLAMQYSSLFQGCWQTEKLPAQDSY